MDLICEEIEPLSVVVERQRRRADAMLLTEEFQAAARYRVAPPKGNGSDGQDE
jgi:hypothetical protein